MLERKVIKRLFFGAVFIILCFIPQRFMVTYFGETASGVIMPLLLIGRTFLINPLLSLLCLLVIAIEAFLASQIILWIIFKKIDEHKESKEYKKIKKEEKIEDYEWKEKEKTIWD